MKNDLRHYIDKVFTGFWSDINLRFELGGESDNGTDQRVRQAINRAVTLFEDIFSNTDIIHLYIKDVETGSKYLYRLLGRLQVDVRIEKSPEDDITYIIKTLSASLSDIPYPKIITGIANNEQGRKPAIDQQIYFVSIDKGIIFYMYDDRGCLIFADESNKLQSLNEKYCDWLVESL